MVDLLPQFESRHQKREGRTLVVGSHIYGPREDRRKRYADVVGIDLIEGPGVDAVCDLNEPHYLGHLGLPKGERQRLFDHIDCISVLEHAKKPWMVAENIEEAMVGDATIMLTVPFVWWVHGYPSDYWRMTTEAVRSIFQHIDWAELVYAHTGLAKDGKIPSVFADEHRYFARTEVYGFGVKA